MAGCAKMNIARSYLFEFKRTILKTHAKITILICRVHDRKSLACIEHLRTIFRD